MAAETTRVKDIPTTATTAAADDYIVIDGATNKVRKGLASNLITAAATAATAAAVATYGLDKFSQSIPWFNVGNTYTGTGASIGGIPMQLGLKSGATGGSATRRMSVDYHPIALIGQRAVYFDATPFVISVVGVRATAMADGSCWFSFGIAHDEVDTAQNTVGFFVNNGVVFSRYRSGGALVDTVTGLSVPTESACLFDIRKGPTTLEIRVNGISGGVVNTGAVSLSSFRGAGAKVVSATGDEAWRFGIPTMSNF